MIKIKGLPIIIGGLMIIFCITVFSLLTQKVNQKVNEIENIKKDIISMQKAKEDASNLKSLYNSYESKFELVDSFFVDLEYLKNFTKILHDIADKEGVELSLSEGGMAKVTDAWPSSVYQIKISGDYDDCHRFWEKLENGPWLAEFLSINLSKGLEGEKMIANFTIRIYNQKNENKANSN